MMLVAFGLIGVGDAVGVGVDVACGFGLVVGGGGGDGVVCVGVVADSVCVNDSVCYILVSLGLRLCYLCSSC